jgi:hypothetical protein
LLVRSGATSVSRGRDCSDSALNVNCFIHANFCQPVIDDGLKVPEKSRETFAIGDSLPWILRGASGVQQI